MFGLLSEWAHGLGYGTRVTEALILSLGVLTLLILGLLANFLAKGILLRAVGRLVRRTATDLDDVFLERQTFARLSHLAPALIVYFLGPLIFAEYPRMAGLCRQFGIIYLLFIIVLVLDSFLNGLHDIYRRTEMARTRPIKGYLQIVKLVLYLSLGIAIFSLILGRSPIVLLSGLGALTAVLLLIFKDAILGFVASIQLAANNMLHVGDWIEMPKYGADGDVIDMSLTTVKVRNWDKTITTIPAYALISDAFRNWRGMEESGGRRIKRALFLDMTSVHFLSDQEQEEFKRIQVLKDYIAGKQKELATWNREQGVDDSVLVNGRRLTNLGTFRAYVAAYLRQHPLVHQDMTFLVRQLAPTPEGLPLEIYVFSRDQEWANYEAIQADIFDHTLAVVPEFGLRVFQSPSGADMREGLARPGL